MREAVADLVSMFGHDFAARMIRTNTTASASFSEEFIRRESDEAIGRELRSMLGDGIRHFEIEPLQQEHNEGWVNTSQLQCLICGVHPGHQHTKAA